MPTTTASCRPRTYRKSSGKSRNIGSSVEPGLPNTEVIPSVRSCSMKVSRTVRDMPTFPLFSASTLPPRPWHRPRGGARFPGPATGAVRRASSGAGLADDRGTARAARPEQRVDGGGNDEPHGEQRDPPRRGEPGDREVGKGSQGGADAEADNLHGSTRRPTLVIGQPVLDRADTE